MLYAIYENNTGLFISIFCENKSRPQLNCNGQCKLALMQKEQEEKDAASMLEQLQSEIVFYSPANMPDLRLAAVADAAPVVHLAHYNQLYSFLFTADMVKPPAATAV